MKTAIFSLYKFSCQKSINDSKDPILIVNHDIQILLLSFSYTM